MKKIAACFKWVVDEADIKTENNRSLNFERAKYKISEYDKNALEAGAILNETKGYDFVAITCGKNVEGGLKDTLSRGPASISYINDPVLTDADSQVTSKVLAGIIKKVGDVDLVICGEGSSDDYAQQVGPRLAALLGYPCVSYVNKLEVTEKGIVVERKLEDGVEVVEVQGAAVITVLPDINSPRIPSLKQILGAKKKPTQKLELADIGLSEKDCRPKQKTITTLATVMERKGERLNSEGCSIKEAAEKLVQKLKSEGTLG